MTEEPLGRQLLSLAEAAEAMPRISGRTISTNAIWRWCRKGIKSRCGDVVYLEHVRLGGKTYTTAEWLTDFGKKLAEADAEHFRHPSQHVAIGECLQQRPSKTSFSKERLAQIEQAEKELREMGL